jgi:hypothetical protein
MAVFSAQTVLDVTGSVIWNVNSGGATHPPTVNTTIVPRLVTAGKDTGPFDIIADFLSATYGPVTLTVTEKVPVSVDVTPKTAAVATSLTEPFVATVTYSDKTFDCNTSASWSASGSAKQPHPASVRRQHWRTRRATTPARHYPRREPSQKAFR